MTPGTLLLRHVHPNWIREGRITSQVFSPTPKDKKRLSVYDGDLMTAEEAYVHYTQQLGLPSLGVMAVPLQNASNRTFLQCLIRWHFRSMS